MNERRGIEIVRPGIHVPKPVGEPQPGVERVDRARRRDRPASPSAGPPICRGRHRDATSGSAGSLKVRRDGDDGKAALRRQEIADHVPAHGGFDACRNSSSSAAVRLRPPGMMVTSSPYFSYVPSTSGLIESARLRVGEPVRARISPCRGRGAGLGPPALPRPGRRWPRPPCASPGDRRHDGVHRPKRQRDTCVVFDSAGRGGAKAFDRAHDLGLMKEPM